MTRSHHFQHNQRRGLGDGGMDEIVFVFADRCPADNGLQNRGPGKNPEQEEGRPALKEAQYPKEGKIKQRLKPSGAFREFFAFAEGLQGLCF